MLEQKPITVPEAAEFLNLSVSYIYRLVSQGTLPHFKSVGGKRVYFKREDLEAWAFGTRVEDDSPASGDDIDARATDYVTGIASAA